VIFRVYVYLPEGNEVQSMKDSALQDLQINHDQPFRSGL
jgi:hypothetical protein